MQILILPGDKIYLRNDFTGFSNSPNDGRPIGTVVDGNSATGIYDVILTLWSAFSGNRIIRSTNAPSRK